MPDACESPWIEAICSFCVFELKLGCESVAVCRLRPFTVPVTSKCPSSAAPLAYRKGWHGAENGCVAVERQPDAE